ncbi:MAG: hypothetical protein JSW71_14655 [Gemmatimonadota bacterium]|nr:MAG: hypothetical protein JSW71_14655 [Gemmatimonadota bacterium]
MFWALGFLILFVALLIPILAIVLDSPVARNFFRADPGTVNELMERVRGLEDEVAQLTQSIEDLREETRFVQRLLDHPDDPDSIKKLPPLE